MSMKDISVLALAALVGGVLGGCADDTAADGTASSGAEGSVASAQPAAEVTTSATEDADEEAAEEVSDIPTGETPTSDDPASCLHGTWVADNEFFLAGIQEFGDEVRSVDGRVVLEFSADGTLETDYQDWLITAVADGGEVQISRDGLDTGTFSATATTLTLVDDHVGSTLTLDASGFEMVLEPQPIAYSEVAYTCSPLSVHIVTADGELELTRD